MYLVNPLKCGLCTTSIVIVCVNDCVYVCVCDLWLPTGIPSWSTVIMLGLYAHSFSKNMITNLTAKSMMQYIAECIYAELCCMTLESELE